MNTKRNLPRRKPDELKTPVEYEEYKDERERIQETLSNEIINNTDVNMSEI